MYIFSRKFLRMEKIQYWKKIRETGGNVYMCIKSGGDQEVVRPCRSADLFRPDRSFHTRAMDCPEEKEIIAADPMM
jgi:hypothetical protein